MTDDLLQLPLFASFASSSSTDDPNSPRSSEPPMSSSEPPTTEMTAATATTPTSRAPARSTRAGVASADSSSSGAKSTAGSDRQVTLLMLIAPRSTVDSMLALPRPTSRGDCGQEARPCPWVGCRHHLLLEVARTKGAARDVRPTSLRLNRANRGRAILGRRPGLESSAAALVVRRWIDDATEQLSSMMYTCSLDVVHDYPDGLSEGSVALLLGVTEQAINAETQRALEKLRTGLRAMQFSDDDDL